MARYNYNQKVLRAVRFLLGLRRKRIQKALRPYGLDRATLVEAQQLLRKATYDRPDQPVDEGQPLLPQLDAFENHWLTIVRAVLRRRCPEICDWVFKNISQTKGVDLVVSVDTVLQRLRALHDGSTRFAEQGAQAIQWLAKRGFTEARLEEGEQLIRQVTEFQSDDDEDDLDSTDDDDFESEEEAAAAAELWGWYLEWSAIARRVITDRTSLRILGFLSSKESTNETVDVAPADSERSAA